MVLPESRLLASLTLPRSTGVSRIIGAMRSFEKVSAISTVGCTTRIGAGSTSIWKPITALKISVLPTCEDDMTVISSAPSSLKASMMPR